VFLILPKACPSGQAGIPVALIGYFLYQLWFLMPQKIKNLTMVNAEIDIKEQIERSDDMRHFIS
jgi:hypothetical protein